MPLTAPISPTPERAAGSQVSPRRIGGVAAGWLCLLSPLLLGGGACKRTPKAPATVAGPAPTATPAATPAAPKASDRKAAQAANRLGMRAYKGKDYATAQGHFVTAIAADESFALPHYNLACVAALTGDVAMSRTQLAFLADSPEPQARRTLRKALYDADLKSLVSDPTVRSLLHWGGVVGGVRVLVDSRDATDEESGRLRKSDESYDEECDSEPTYRATWALTGELLPEHAGQEVIVASLASGVAVFDARGKLIVRGGGYDCVGSSAGLFGIALAQIVPDPEPEILVHYESGGRESHAQALDILKRKGDTLATILTFTLSSSERVRGDDDEGSDERTTDGALSLASDGSLVAMEPGAKEARRLRFHAEKFAFMSPDAVVSPAAASTPGGGAGPQRKSGKAK